MHPAISVIFFTVTSGAGFGLIALIGLGWPMRDGLVPAFLVALLAGGLAAAGLISSTFHLGHPERAWRAFSQWRSSWLSREGVLAVAALVLFAAYSLTWMFAGVRLAALGYLVAALALATVLATGMIYASLKSIPQWHGVLTPLCYLAFSLASAALLAGATGVGSDLSGIGVAWIGFATLVLAWAIKLAWWRRAGAIGFSATGSDTGTATGLGKLGEVRLLERPHTGENYLTREMVHRIGRKHAAKLRAIALVAGFAVPSVLCLIALLGAVNMAFAAAALSLAVGLFAERWLFFAEAQHSVSLYYD